MPDVSTRTPSAPVSGTTTAQFRERQTPGPGLWLISASFGGLLGILLLPLSTTAALVVAPILAVAVCVLVFSTCPLIVVADGRLVAGRAQIPVHLLGEPEVLERDDWDRAMATGFEPLAFHCTRGWIHSGVRLEVQDPQDPVPSWVLSSRRPEDLALAIRAARSTTRGEDPTA